MTEKVQIHILQTSDLSPRPASIKVLSDYGETVIRVHDSNRLVVGEHLAVEATEAEFAAWFGSNFVWVGSGAPMEQEFDYLQMKGLG